MRIYIVRYKIYQDDNYYYDCFVDKKELQEFYYSIYNYVCKPYEFYVLYTSLSDCKDISSFVFIGGVFKLI